MNDLIPVDFNSIKVSCPEHEVMLDKIRNNFPEIHRATSLFGKSQSQFMDNFLTVSHPTPLRNVRQILAEINRMKEALVENNYRIRKKNIEIKMKIRDLKAEDDSLKREMLEVEIEELKSQQEVSKNYVSGAIRKVAAYIEQYNSILSKYDLKDFNEKDFELDEERYHIMKAFDQGLTAARARGGGVDEGNHIYFNQIGINGSVAATEVAHFLIEERKMLQQNKEPDHQMVRDFLNKMADKFAGCSKSLIESKGMIGLTEDALLMSGDRTLLDDK